MGAPAAGDIIIRGGSGWQRLQSPADATKYLDGTGAYTVPTGTGNSDWTTTIFKSSTDTVTNSSTFASDSELTLTLTANKVYMWEIVILYSGTSAAADYKQQLLINQNLGNAAQWIGTSVNLGTALGVNAIANALGLNSGGNAIWPQSGALASGTDGASSVFNFHAWGTIVVPNAATTFTYQFAQNVITAANSVSTLIGSMMRVKILN